MRRRKLHEYRPVLAALLAMASAVTLVPGATAEAAGSAAEEAALDPRVSGRLFAASSPFNQVIPTNAQVDPRSAQYVQMLVKSRKAKGFNIAINDWTVAAYFAEQGTPRHDVQIAGQPPGAHYDRAFIHDVTRVMRSVPIPDRAKPDPSEDAHLTIIDPATRCSYDFYGAKKTATGWTALWANVTTTASSGVYPQGLSSRATGFSALAGVIWPSELRAGRINHALTFAFPFTKKGGPVAPATASDGKTDLAAALPQGARVQLDPALDLRTLKLSPYELTIAEALQRYGMYLADTGGALALYAVHPQSFATNPYAGLLPADDWGLLNKIPVNKFRVLNTGPQIARTPLNVVPSTCAKIEVTS